MKGCLSRITCHVRVGSITEEKVNHGAVTMEGSIVEWGETTPSWMNKINTSVKFKDVNLQTDLRAL